MTVCFLTQKSFCIHGSDRSCVVTIASCSTTFLTNILHTPVKNGCHSHIVVGILGNKLPDQCTKGREQANIWRHTAHNRNKNSLHRNSLRTWPCTRFLPGSSKQCQRYNIQNGCLGGVQNSIDECKTATQTFQADIFCDKTFELHTSNNYPKVWACCFLYVSNLNNLVNVWHWYLQPRGSYFRYEAGVVWLAVLHIYQHVCFFHQKEWRA